LFSLNGGVKQWRGGENEPFSSFKRQYLENGIGDTSEVILLMTNKKSHKRFRLTPRSMTLYDLDLL